MQKQFSVYHGSFWTDENQFTKPSMKYSAYYGIFFSNSWTTSSNYAIQKNDLGTPVILSGQLIFKNPYYLTPEELNALMDNYCSGTMNPFFRKIKSKGFDGIIYPQTNMGVEFLSFSGKKFKVKEVFLYENGWKKHI